MSSTHRLCFLRSKCLHWIFLSSFLCSLWFGFFCLVWYLVCIFFLLPDTFLSFLSTVLHIDIYRITLLCPTICLLQVLHFSKIAENTRGATNDRVSHRAPDLEGHGIQQGHSLNWEFQTKWEKSIFRGHLMWNTVDRVVAHFMLHMYFTSLLSWEESSMCFTVRALKPKGASNCALLFRKEKCGKCNCSEPQWLHPS